MLLVGLAINVLGLGWLATETDTPGWAFACASFGAGAVPPATSAWIADLTRGDQRQLAYTVQYVCINVGMGMGPLLGGLLLSNLALAGLADVGVLPPSSRGLARDILSCVALPSGALAYVALLLPWLRRRGPVVRALEHAGRLSLTHYLSQSLVLAAVFYGVGLGAWGRLGATEGAAVGLLLVAGQIGVSGSVLRRLRIGPAERLLRALDLRPQRG